jgi:hypothetical protein
MLAPHMRVSHNQGVVEVVGTDEFEAWFLGLDELDQDSVGRTVDMLEMEGVALRFPHSSAINGTRYPLRELRIKSRGKQIRVFYAFDPARQAALLIGGDKVGDDRFYEVMIPRAEKIWLEYLSETQGGR